MTWDDRVVEVNKSSKEDDEARSWDYAQAQEVLACSVAACAQFFVHTLRAEVYIMREAFVVGGVVGFSMWVCFLWMKRVRTPGRILHFSLGRHGSGDGAVCLAL